MSRKKDEFTFSTGEDGEKVEVSKTLISRLINSGMEFLISTGEGNERATIKPLSLPKDVITYIFSQVDRSKSEIVSLFGREFKRFLDATDLSEEVVKAMSQMSVQVKAEISFKKKSDDDEDRDESASDAKQEKPQSKTTKRGGRKS